MNTLIKAQFARILILLVCTFFSGSCALSSFSGTYRSDAFEILRSDSYFSEHANLQEETAYFVHDISAGIRARNEVLVKKQSPKTYPPDRKGNPTLATLEKFSELPNNKADIITHSFINISVKTQQVTSKNTALLSIAAFIRNGILRI